MVRLASSKWVLGFSLVILVILTIWLLLPVFSQRGARPAGHNLVASNSRPALGGMTTSRPGDSGTAASKNSSGIGELLPRVLPGLKASVADPAQPTNHLDVKRMPMISSPTKLGRSTNPEVNRLLDLHNVEQDKLSHIKFTGTCSWVGFKQKDRPFTLDFDRVSDTAEMICNEESCAYHGGGLTTFDHPRVGAMDLDSLYLLTFRKYDPEQFQSAEKDTLTRQTENGQTVSIPVVVLRSETETLKFNAETNQLLQAQYKVTAGMVTVDMSMFTPTDRAAGEAGPHIPLKVHVKTPESMFPVRITGPRKSELELQIDPQAVEVLPPN